MAMLIMKSANKGLVNFLCVAYEMSYICTTVLTLLIYSSFRKVVLECHQTNTVKKVSLKLPLSRKITNVYLM